MSVLKRAALVLLAMLAAAPLGHPGLRGQERPRTRVDSFGVAQVWVPPGSFLMGTDSAGTAALIAQRPPGWVASALASEQPQHLVRISEGYWIDRHEVTNRAFQAFVAAGAYGNRAVWSDSGWAWLRRQGGSHLPLTCETSLLPDGPRVCVTWYEAEAYAAWRGGRLPTEAEWEYAARGPGSPTYPWGDEWDEGRTNVVGSSGLTAVGSYPAGASWVGALDMVGNAMEWVRDWLDARYYHASPPVDPSGPATGRVKVEKGGWWGSNRFVARAAYRHFEDPPAYQDHHIGFRVVTRR